MWTPDNKLWFSSTEGDRKPLPIQIFMHTDESNRQTIELVPTYTDPYAIRRFIDITPYEFLEVVASEIDRGKTGNFVRVAIDGVTMPGRGRKGIFALTHEDHDRHNFSWHRGPKDHHLNPNITPGTFLHFKRTGIISAEIFLGDPLLYPQPLTRAEFYYLDRNSEKK